MLDISPNMYNMAKSKIGGIANYISEDRQNTEVFIQGSFRYGTMIRPYHKDKAGDYDIDAVVRYDGDMKNNLPGNVKKKLGNTLSSSPYGKFLDKKEGRRCWTLNYEELNDSNEKVDFHIDLLPCVDKEPGSEIIAFTDKIDLEYTWEISDPKGYAEWFENINKKRYNEYITAGIKRVYEKYSSEFDSIEEVSDMHVRTPLQAVIQILKRHRDVMFVDNPEDKPISMIITTCVSNIVNRDSYTYNNTYDLLNRTLEQLQSNKEYYKVNGKWNIPNPVNKEENLADKWNEEGRKAEAYFKWLKQARKDLIDLLEDPPEDIKEDLKRSLGFTDDQISSLDFDVREPISVNINNKTPKPYGEL